MLDLEGVGDGVEAGAQVSGGGDTDLRRRRRCPQRGRLRTAAEDGHANGHEEGRDHDRIAAGPAETMMRWRAGHAAILVIQMGRRR